MTSRGGAVDVQASVVSIGKEQGGVWSALLLAPPIAQAAKPMQFVQVRVGQGSDPFLRRPFGLSRIDGESGLIGITWAVVGKGTSMMTAWEPGDTVPVLGPLGNGFDPASPACGGASPDAEAESRGTYPFWLIGGGTGILPLYPLARRLRQVGSKVTVFYGAKSAELLLDTGRFAELGCETRICTEDGGTGIEGFVTAAIEKELRAGLLPGKSDGPPTPSPDAAVCRAVSAPIAVACGPTPMLQAVKRQLADTGITLYVSLEERMACGTGLCKGCAVKAAPPREGYLHVCSDGPVFRAAHVLLGGDE